MFKSVLFLQFNKINASFDNSVKIKGFPTYITTEFSEKYLFYKFVKNTLYKQRGIKLTGDDCKKLFPKKDKEPDFYHRDGNNIFLFENKDIKINKDVLNSKDYNKIGDELNKKLVRKVGVDQLVEHIKAIDARNFIWDKKLPKHPRTPDYLDDFEDDFEDEFDNDFFEDEDDEPAAESKDASADKTED